MGNIVVREYTERLRKDDAPVHVLSPSADLLDVGDPLLITLNVCTLVKEHIGQFRYNTEKNARAP